MHNNPAQTTKRSRDTKHKHTNKRSVFRLVYSFSFSQARTSGFERMNDSPCTDDQHGDEYDTRQTEGHLRR